ncbi:MAG: ABC transporter ATP-binding protein [Rhodospirillaceae bacterium]|nr:ABC transporter ATP-binding protein [Rhodospirillaceae bacterium]
MNGRPNRSLELFDLSHDFGDVRAVDHVSLHVDEGEVICLLGPSGCGKSTILRLAAGLETVQQGRVAMQDQLVADGALGQSLPPERRGVGLVFQDFALFPHLTVARNVAFGLARLDASQRAVRIAEVLGQVDMADYADAYPHALSGGQQQRIALARALAPQPAILLLDEPFSGLDARLREQIRDDTLHVLKRSGTATLMVTHDPEEAMFMADRIYLMQAGRVVQSGSPDAIYHRPVSPFVARFFTATNDLGGVVHGGMVQCPLGDLPAPGYAEGAVVQILLRPESIHLVGAGGVDPSGWIVPATVEEVRFLGSSKLLVVRLASGENRSLTLRVRHAGRLLPEPGSQILLQLDPADALIFPESRAGDDQYRRASTEIPDLSAG